MSGRLTVISAEFTFPPKKPVENGLDLAVDDFSAGKPLTIRGRIRWPTDMQPGVNGFPFATVVLVGRRVDSSMGSTLPGKRSATWRSPE